MVCTSQRRALPLAVVLLLAVAGCQPAASAPASKPSSSKQAAPTAPPAPSIGGNVAAGKRLIVVKGCNACHRAPGVPEAVGVVGPDLKGIANTRSRPKLAATIENTPENMRRWLLDPQAVKPGTAMPNLGLTGTEATDITAFLETLR